ncbi:MBL fold metallo-hydrolase RNA specificity domain-containing protein [Roseibium litorale]|uniref:MBL fold metallo-hydrolase n=1 Tax=Roseibium litorale TaxID=2803841 RepID=A0ABR9CPB1_9HYPH|nr:MBL fold metallo-hydrolase [Roseibium litorale]MBD8892686.1 MBL fold metallo-hydrolase [Roseibium litorale]
MNYPKIRFHGAARGVTGSCFKLETEAGTILIDCGMFQGAKTEKELNYKPFPFRPGDIDAVLLTHAHIDHSGLLPKLVKHGFRGEIYATTATCDLVEVMLLDSAHIQEIEVFQYNRRASKKRRGSVSPIYDEMDVRRTVDQLRSTRYGRWVEVLPGIRARFWNAGHMLGSASVEIEVQSETEKPMRLLFSGDIGPDFKLLHPDPEGPVNIDYLFCESTYGDRERKDVEPKQRRKILAHEVREANKLGGALIIPSFAVERAQELLSDLGQLMADGELPPIPVYIDSPLAIQATQVFARHAQELEQEAKFLQGLNSRNLHFSQTAEQSKALDRVRGFHIVIAASGMCEAGRIRHRLKNWLWREAATVLIVGFQAQGTLGRILLEGAQNVRIQGEDIAVRARIRSIDQYSGHADKTELLGWIKERQPVHKGVFLVHGEEEAMGELAAEVRRLLGEEKVLMPCLDACYELTPGGAVAVSEGILPRLALEQVAHLDWHNEVTKLILDINEQLRMIEDDKSRAVLIRKLRRALDEGRI